MEDTMNFASFTIMHRNADDMPDKCYYYDSPEATYLAASINVCRRILNKQEVRLKSEEFAADYDKTKPPAPWYKGRDMKCLANDFINAILLDFPLVFVDEKLQNPDFLAFSSKTPWDEFFDIRKQWIRLNGARVKDMCHVAQKAREAADPNSEATKQLRGFMFLFNNVFLHELGHHFMTYLTQGQAESPAGFYGRGYGVTQGASSTRGEAGRYLEKLLFGGLLYNRRNNAWDDHQPGLPCLVTDVDVRQISQESINETLQHKFNLGYRNSGRVIHVHTLGEGRKEPGPAGLWTDPLKWPIDVDKLMNDKDREEVLLGPGSNLYRMAWEDI